MTLKEKKKTKEEYPTNPVTGCPLWIENYAKAAKNKFEDETVTKRSHRVRK
tara:strand:- start:612 stop:764 length:153 start_codon:yes stop_codon:yes gene_type:complete